MYGYVINYCLKISGCQRGYRLNQGIMGSADDAARVGMALKIL